jgi:hypothetical protein
VCALREAHWLFLAIGARAFADRAARERRATGDPCKVFLKLGITSRAQLPESVGCGPCS